MVYGNCKDFECRSREKCIFYRDDLCGRVKFCHVAFPRMPQCSFCMNEKICPAAKKNSKRRKMPWTL